HLTTFPEAADILGPNAATIESVTEPNVDWNIVKETLDWKKIRGVRETVLKALEEARNQKLIGGNLQAQVTLTAADPVFSVLERFKNDLRYFFIVSAVELKKGTSNGDAPVSVQVSKAPGLKCERCWNFSTHVGDDKDYPTVCERCSAVLKEIGAEISGA
ncbi:MAG: zinc finger domain-containing protein, partial [Terriglobales bacterium]